MSYFKELSDYQTYAQGQDDFHFIYNANSGGGQSFLGGKYINEKGELSSPTNLDGCIGVFSILLKKENNTERYIELNDEKGLYEIKPRGEGSSSMKLGIGTKMVSPSKLISAFFMLPPTCTIKSPSNLENSILTANNFWLQSMWLKCNKHSSSDKQVNLVPIDFVYCGGCNKDQQESVRYFELEGQKRVEDLISISEKIDFIPSYLRQYVEVFTNIYLGESPFEFDLCLTATKQIMSLLAKNFPDKYAGIEDPLPFLMALVFPANKLRKVSQTPLKNTPLQQIYYGAPGTGKSFEIDTKIKANNLSAVRTTFHPDSDYSTFVGAYKPVIEETQAKVVPVVVNNGISLNQNEGTYTEKRITYKFVMQAFMKAYLAAWKKMADNPNCPKAQILVIEEINRGNCAQIFGDLFQLLDRACNGFSSYPIEADEDLSQAINEAFKESKDYHLNSSINVEGCVKDYVSNYDASLSEDIQEGRILLLPPNLYIWATMNTSDQSLFPIDSAFKRRWEWKYVKITNGYEKKDNGEFKRDTNENKIKLDWKIETNGEDWYGFICQINRIISNMTSSADKQLGYFFCQANEYGKITAETFVSKVIFYLWNDVFKDYGFDEGNLFKYKRLDKDGNRVGEDLDLTFPDFYDEDGNVAPDVVQQFIEHVMAWEKDNKKDNN